MYYSIVSNRVESTGSRKIHHKQIHPLGLYCNPPLNYLFFVFFVNLFCFDFWLLFSFFFFHKCEKNIFNTALIVLAMSAIFGEILVWMAEYWWADCKGGKDISGGGGKKNTKRTKNSKSVFFQIVNSPYAWKLKSKSGTCLHNFEIFILYRSWKRCTFPI